MIKEDEKFPITPLQALALIKVNGAGDVHTFRSTHIALLGAHWTRDQIARTLEHFADKIELAGEMATSMKHGVCVIDDKGPVFIETDEEKLRIFKLGNLAHGQEEH